MLKHNVNINDLQELLDSDDELPTNYKEEPDIPAYLDDKRFDAIKFNWLKNNKIKSISVKPPMPTVKPPATPIKAPGTTPKPPVTLCNPLASALVQCSSNTPQQENIPAANQEFSNKNLIKKGILKEEDILCMKSVAAQTTDEAALLWFIDFLMLKDLQADYRFLKSCLVLAQENYGKSRKQYSQIFYPKSLNKCFELVVK